MKVLEQLPWGMFWTPKNTQKLFSVPFLTTKEASGTTLDSTFLSKRLKHFFRHLELQNLSSIGHGMSERERSAGGEVISDLWKESVLKDQSVPAGSPPHPPLGKKWVVVIVVVVRFHYYRIRFHIYQIPHWWPTAIITGKNQSNMSRS